MAVKNEYIIKVTERGAKNTEKKLRGVGGALGNMAKKAGMVAGAFFGTRALLDGMKQAIQLSAKFEGVSTGFNQLAKSSGFASDTLNKLQIATDNTMSSMDLMTQANNAMLLGIFESDDQMANMFDTAQRLAKALGKDAAFGIESLVTGMGRQSKLMLDNLGIMVKAEDAYKAFADELGTTVSGLTDQEKKQAFVNEAMKEANKLVKNLGEEQLTTQDALAQTATALENVAITIGDRLAPATVAVANMFTDMLNSIGAVAFAQGDISESTLRLISDEKLLEFTLKEVTNELNQMNMTTAGQILAGKKSGATSEAQREKYAGLKEEIKLVTDRLNDFNILLIDSAEKPPPLPMVFALPDDEFERSFKQGERMNEFIANLSAERINLERLERMAVEKSEAAKIAARQKSLVESIKMATLSGQSAEQAMENAVRAEIMEAVAGHAASIFKSVPFPFNIALAAGAGSVVSGMITSLLAPIKKMKFQEGGLIGGRRHSSGGTMIEAEQGEFVMNRNAVNRIGVGGMNAINQGGGAVTVNVSGNVMTQDFVEGELAEAITEASRKGVSFLGTS